MVRDAAAITGIFKKAERFNRTVSMGMPSSGARVALLLDLMEPSGAVEAHRALAQAIADVSVAIARKG